MIELRGQVAVVTGGNGGIGLGMAEGLVAAGAGVAIWARDEGKSAAAVAHLRSLDPDVPLLALPCDVADPASVERAMADTVAALGRVDACVANSGTSGYAPFLDCTYDEWRRVVSVNLDGVFLTLQAAARQMVAQGDGGALVAIGSTSSVHGAPTTPHYAAAKTGLLGLVRSAAVALARHQIRVNALVPGWTVTGLTAGLTADERFMDVTTRRTPVRRWGEPGDFREVAAFLCDRSQSFHTGDTVTIDGGYTVF